MAKAGSAGVPHFFTDVGWSTTARLGRGARRAGRGPRTGAERDAGLLAAARGDAQGASDDGWFRSGDVGVADEDGFLCISDRLKDMIISGGENIYPAEVESALYGHPAVAECAVIGVPDDRWGEVGKALIVLRPGRTEQPGDLVAHLDGRLARYKIPKHVELVPELPRNAAGKLLKAQIRARYGTSEPVVSMKDAT